MQVEHRYQLRLRSGMEQVAITEDGLHVPRTGTIRWREITEVNLNHVPMTKYNEAHFVCRIYAGLQRVEIRAYSEYAIECKEYNDFLSALHARLIAHTKAIRFTTGMRGKTGYLGIMVGTASVFAIMLALIVFAMATRGNILVGIGMFALTATSGFFLLRWAMRSLKPTEYDPQLLPDAMLPGRNRAGASGAA